MRSGFFLIVTFTLSALRATQERQEELGQFIVHDLRSPLPNVMTGLQTLQDIAGESMDTTQKGLVEMCLVSCKGGRIWLESEINYGTTITFTLPVSVS